MVGDGWAWSSPAYQPTALIVLSIIFGSGILIYFFRDKNHYFTVSWDSIKSWLIAAPLLFLFMGLPKPFPLVFLVLMAVYGVRIFYQIMGIFIYTPFILISYAGIFALGVCVYFNNVFMYNLIPMFVLAACCMVPIAMNSYRHMIQIISLTLLGFIFLGWSLLHLGLVTNFTGGLYQLLYVIVLTEFCDNTNMALSPYVGGKKLFSRIQPLRTRWGIVLSIILTIFLAATMSFLLPYRADEYWLAAGIITSLGGLMGDLVMSVVRRDAGVKIVGPFIIGKGDILQRMDRLIFVAPIYYFVMLYLNKGV
ncbi:MAG TPA: phosphatidate cytidylyltransferase [Pseudobdellovibrionaceae bacterium]|nr:phosphatidate cytidylyltransferase [Pseudobdellovibrionaceae bacterium]